jgi:hypothetical protein
MLQNWFTDSMIRIGRDIEIQAHLSFDTVSTVWIPRTGVFKYLPRYTNDNSEMIAVPKSEP